MKTLYKIIAGSKLYGLDGPDSDTDIRTVHLPDLFDAFGIKPDNNVEQDHNKDTGEDQESMPFAKHTALAYCSNPNILEHLYAPEDKILEVDLFYEDIILGNRDKFLSKLALQRFCGYARGQLARLKTHRGWLLNPPTHRPTREEYGLSLERRFTDKTTISTLNHQPTEDLLDLGFTEESIHLIRSEFKYMQALEYWNKFENWQKNRSPARAQGEAKYGFDLKHASHLLRLLKMAWEIGEGKGCIPCRTGIDAEELKAIKYHGIYTYDELIEIANRIEAEARTSFTYNLTLPATPNLEYINQLYLKVCFEHYDLFWNR